MTRPVGAVAAVMVCAYGWAVVTFAPPAVAAAVWVWQHPGTAAVGALFAAVIGAAAADGIRRGTR